MLSSLDDEAAASALGDGGSAVAGATGRTWRTGRCGQLFGRVLLSTRMASALQEAPDLFLDELLDHGLVHWPPGARGPAWQARRLTAAYSHS